MRYRKVLIVIPIVIALIAAGGIFWLIDTMTVSESELVVREDGALDVSHGMALDLFLAKCEPRQPLPQLRAEELIIDGYVRRFYYSAPATPSVSASLLLVLHGSGGSARQMYNVFGEQLNALAQKDNVAIIYAEGFGGGWNDLRTQSPHISKKRDINDVEFIRQIQAWAAKHLDTKDSSRYYLGASNGGQMILRLLVEAPELVTAAAVIGANLPNNPVYEKAYDALQARPVMFVNGTDDTVVPFNGGEVKIMHVFNFGYVYSADETARRWLQAANIVTAPRVSIIDTVDDNTSITFSRWREPGKPEIRTYHVNGGKHTVPMPRTGNDCERMITTSHDMNTIEEAWQFFAGTR